MTSLSFRVNLPLGSVHIELSDSDAEKLVNFFAKDIAKEWVGMPFLSDVLSESYHSLPILSEFLTNP